MPRAKRSPSLAKFFEQSASPVYILDSENQIIYCNDSLCSWVGVAKTTLLGVVCRYDAALDPETPEGVAAQLCPAPTVWQETTSRSQIGFPSSDGGKDFREVCFVTLSGGRDDAESCTGVLAVAAVKASMSTAVDIDAQQPLHEQLHRMLVTLCQDRLHR